MPFRLLEIHIKLRHVEIAYGLLLGLGYSTIEEKKHRKFILLRTNLKKGERGTIILGRLKHRDTENILIHAQIKILKDLSWRTRYAKNAKAIEILPGLIIDPLRRQADRGGEKHLLIKASMAFGTGTHPTTFLCAQFMDRVIRQEKIASMIDLGCGSGILSLIAATRGIKNISAVDIDPDALTVAQNNSRINKITGIKFYPQLNKIASKVDLIVANIELSTLLQLQPAILGKLKKNSWLILSGLLYQDKQAICASYQSLDLVAQKNKHSWACFLFASGQ